MLEWLDGLAGPEYAQAILWTFGALILLVIVLVIIKLIRSLTFGTFVAGGRNRKTRLAVMDATAVDSHRRLVLIRRDDIEHLLLIGGPTDVVVERDIRLGQQRRPALTADAAREAQPPRARSPEPQQPRPITQPQGAERPTAQRAPVAPAPVHRLPPLPSYAPAPRPEPARMPPAAHGLPARHETRVSPAPQPLPASREPQRDDLDDALLKELEVSLDNGRGRPDAKGPVSLDDEMTKLLGELSSHKR